MKKNLIILFFLFFYGSFIKEVKASCDFKTGKYINELSFPNTINSIDIKLKNPRKYVKNAFRILTSENIIIDKKYRKKFKANIQVNYKFGSCSYKAKVWQNGDNKNHIKFSHGQLERSLNVKLEDGNILNATKFKLFIPETRNNHNEILTTLILKNLGFITPETFEVKVNKNNYISKMIFQEDSQKELLERNLRREGPIFEGDETIIWNSDGFQRDLEFLSLSRLINSKWFLKGKSSQAITLTSFSNLQAAYLERLSLLDDFIYINPNKSKNDIFADYRFLLLSLNGLNALRPHNMKYYFNSFENKFEPIYYDGKIKFNDKKNIHNKNRFKAEIDMINLSNDYIFPYLNLIEEEDFINQIKREFKLRVLNYDIKSDQLIDKGINSLLLKSKYLQKKLRGEKFKIIPKNDNRFLFLRKNSILKAEKNIIKNFDINNEIVELVLEDDQKIITDLNSMSKIISRKEIEKERYLFLPLNYSNNINDNLIKTTIPELNTQIIHHKKSVIIFKNHEFSPELIIIPNVKDQSILINGGKLNNLNILFRGSNNFSKKQHDLQRFNERGLTGCLNIYNADFRNTSVEVNGGKCEDSLNIVSSRGQLSNVVINNPFQDGVDLDFSDISINKILIKNAGNDCLDVSSGNYFISNANFQNCFDKAISVGEKSIFEAGEIKISDSKIGVAVKDFSKFFNKKISIKNSSYCFQVFQKKQEFGGAYAKLNDIKCKGDYKIDANSVIEFGE